MRINIILGSLVLAGALLCIPDGSRATPVDVVVSVRVAPPVLPVYVQPVCPGQGYIWQPGYWNYVGEGYYWVPGAWVLPPSAGLLWTPGYWGFSGGFYVWNVGFWGPTVGFYGGINYGFGYPGRGFYGGYWRGGQYFYNTQVTNINRTVIHNVYSSGVVNERSANRISFNGGAHGIQARPTAAELSVSHEHHIAMTSAQMQHEHDAQNHGHTGVTAVTRSAALSNHRESANNKATNAERAGAKNPRASAQPERSVHKTAAPAKPAAERSEKTNAHRPAPTRTEKPPATHTEKPPATHTEKPPATHTEKLAATHTEKPPATRTEKPAATHTEKTPATHTEKTPATHAEKPAVHQQASKPASRTAHEQSTSKSPTLQQHATTAHASEHTSATHPVAREQSHANTNKP